MSKSEKFVMTGAGGKMGREMGGRESGEEGRNPIIIWWIIGKH